MHRTYLKAVATGSSIIMLALLVAGIRIAAVDASQAEALVAEAAQDYTPTVSYTQPPEPVEVAFLGDSFTAGTGTNESKFKRWTTLVAEEHGWLELNYGKGGTNYNTNGPQSGGLSYANRLTDLIISQPDIVIVSTAGNDLNQIQEPGIRKTFQRLREGLPDARIIATSPYYRAGDYPENFVAFGKDIKREVEKVGGEYLEIGHPLRNHPGAMAEDAAHPNNFGYRLLADAVTKALS